MAADIRPRRWCWTARLRPRGRRCLQRGGHLILILISFFFAVSAAAGAAGNGSGGDEDPLHASPSDGAPQGSATTAVQFATEQAWFQVVRNPGVGDEEQERYWRLEIIPHSPPRVPDNVSRDWLPYLPAATSRDGDILRYISRYQNRHLRASRNLAEIAQANSSAPVASSSAANSSALASTHPVRRLTLIDSPETPSPSVGRKLRRKFVRRRPVEGAESSSSDSAGEGKHAAERAKKEVSKRGKARGGSKGTRRQYFEMEAEEAQAPQASDNESSCPSLVSTSPESHSSAADSPGSLADFVVEDEEDSEQESSESSSSEENNNSAQRYAFRRWRTIVSQQNAASKQGLWYKHVRYSERRVTNRSGVPLLHVSGLRQGCSQFHERSKCSVQGCERAAISNKLVCCELCGRRLVNQIPMPSSQWVHRHCLYPDLDLHEEECTDVVRRTSAVCNEITRSSTRDSPMAQESEERAGEMGYHQIDVGGGGDCFYRAIAYLAYGTETRYLDVRREMAAYLRRNAERYRGFLVDLEDMAASISTSGQPTDGNIEVRLAADTFGRQVTIFASSEEYDIEAFPATYRERSTRSMENHDDIQNLTLLLRPERIFSQDDPWPEHTLSDSSRMMLVFLPSPSGYSEGAGVGHYRVRAKRDLGTNVREDHAMINCKSAINLFSVVAVAAF